MDITCLQGNISLSQALAMFARNADWSMYGGLWAPCAGSVTPWNTHLGVEEFPPDGKPIHILSSVAQLQEYDER